MNDKETGFGIFAILVVGAVLSFVSIIAADRVIKYQDRPEEVQRFELKVSKCPVIKGIVVCGQRREV